MQRTLCRVSGGQEARFLLSPLLPLLFSCCLGLFPSPPWHHPHLQHPWVQPQTLLLGQIWVFFHLLIPKHKVLRNLEVALSPESPFVSKIPSPFDSWSQIWVFYSQTSQCHCSKLDLGMPWGCSGHTWTKILGDSVKHSTNPHFLP